MRYEPGDDPTEDTSVHCTARGCVNRVEYDPWYGWAALCRWCRAAHEHQAPTADDGAPLAPLDGCETVRVKTPTDAELIAELEQHAEAGQ